MFDTRQAEAMAYEENARFDRYDGWDDIDPDFEALCDEQACAAEIAGLDEPADWDDSWLEDEETDNVDDST